MSALARVRSTGSDRGAPKHPPTRTTTRSWPWQLCTVVVVLGVWEAAGRIEPLYASYPSAIAAGFYEIAFKTNEVLPALGTTITGLGLGFLIAAVLGMLIGYLVGISRTLEILLDPYISALYAIPRITIIPLLILLLGIHFELRVTIATLSAIFPIIMNTQAGVKAVDTELIDTGRAFTASRWQSLRTIVLPASLPHVFAGLRIGIIRALGGIIVAEMTAALVGTGALLVRYQRFFQTDKLLGPVLILGLMSIMLGSAIGFAERRAMPWVWKRRPR